MSNSKLFLFIVSGTGLIILGVTFFYMPHYLTNKISLKGSISKEMAIRSGCNKKDTICIMKNGKIIDKKLSTQEIKNENKKYANSQVQHIAYANNVALAIMAIRAYTRVPNLNLSLLENNTPSYISYFCSEDNKCWAVDNQTHTVIPQN